MIVKSVDTEWKFNMNIKKCRVDVYIVKKYYILTVQVM